LSHRRLLGLLVGTALLAGCGGGGNTTPAPAPVVVPSVDPNSGTATQSIPASGGSLSATAGTNTVTVTAPAGAFPSGATVTLTIVSSSSIPASGQRKVQAAPSGQLVAFTIDAGSATPAVPLTVAVTGATVPSGATPRLSGYNAGAYDDVAAESATGSTLTTTSDVHFPGVTLTSKTLYVLYAGSALGSGDGTITVNGPAAAVPTGSTATFTAAEATANGFPYLARTFTYALDNPNAGAINASSGVFTAGATGAGATVTATDTSVATRTGTKAVSTASSRPGVGTSARYTGVLTENDTNNIIGSSPVSATSTAAVTSNVTTSTDGFGNTVFSNAESDVAQLRTTFVSTTATVAYQNVTGGTNVRTLSTIATDSSGVSLETDYASTNGLVTILPETDGMTFSNDGALTYKETDPGINPGGVTTTNVVNGDGTYTRTTNTIDSFGNPQQDVSTQTVTFTGQYLIHELAGPGTAGRAFTFTAPAGGNPPTIGYYDLTAAGALGTQRGQIQPAFNWLASVTRLVTETDTVAANQPLDASCAPTSAYVKNSTLVKQVLTTVDIVFGTYETRTSSSYDQPGPGTVCTVVSDAIQNFYDYSGQEGGFRLFPAQSSTPVATVQIKESLSLQSVTTPSSNARSAQSVGGGFVLPRSVVVSRVDSIVHQNAMKRLLSLRKAGGNR